MSSEEQEKSEALYRAVNEQLERQNTILAAQYDLAKKMAEAQGINISSLNKSKTSYDGLYGATNKQSAAAEANAQSLKIMQDASANFSKALTNSTASAVSFGKALLSNEQGFAKYNQTLSSAGDAAMSLGKNFGLLGMGLGIAIKGLTMAAEQFTKQADNTLKATDNLSKLGGAGALTADQVLTMGHKAGLTSANLDVMTKAAAKANTGMAGLGGTVGEGIVAFGKMTAVTSEQRQAFQRMGVSQEELMAQQADYVKLQEMSGKSMAASAKDGDKLRKQSLEYAENLTRLSALTGKSADKLQAEQNAAMLEYEEIVATRLEDDKIRKLRSEKNAVEADALQKEQDARKAYITQVTSTLGKDAGLQVAKVARTGSFDQSTAGLATLGVSAEQVQKGYKGKTAEEAQRGAAEFSQSFKEKQSERIGQMGTALQYGGEALGKQMGLGKESLQETGKFMDRNEVTAYEDSRKKTKGLASGEAGAGGAAATDPAQIARNKLTETEIEAKVALDKFIASYNPLLKGFDTGTVAALALATAATVAAAALAKMAASAAMDKLGLGGDGPDKKGKGKDKSARARDSKGRFVKGASAVKDVSALSKMAGTAGRFAGPAAGVLAVGAGAYTAYQGAKDVDEKVKSGELTKDEGTVKKSEAVGTGVGQAAGGAAGAYGGAIAGAAIGSVVPVVGTLIGGILGAAVGGWLGSKGGEIVGEKVGKSVGETMVDKPIPITSGGGSAGGGGGGSASGGGGGGGSAAMSSGQSSKKAPAVGSAPAISFPSAGSSGSDGGADGKTGTGSTDMPKKSKGSSVSLDEKAVKDMIIRHEGKVNKPYKDSLGLWTVGVGHLIGDGKSLPDSWNREFSDAEVMKMFDEDYAHHRKAAEGIPGFDKFNSAGQGALTDLTFNMGPSWYKRFPNTAKKIEAGNAEGAAEGLQDSKWYGQVGKRAPTITGLISQGGLQAKDGGLADGPMEGYPATLHGNEAILPLNPDSIITKLLNTSESQLKSEMNNNITTNTSSSDDGSNQIMADLYIMMEEKFDAMINALEDGNSQTEKLVKFSAV